MKEKGQNHQAPVTPGHWSDIAQVWAQVGPPLRPSTQDIAFFNEAIGCWGRDNTAPRALILGVTPELYRLSWPKGTDILAVDHTQSMIDALWPGPQNTAICANWSTMPLPERSRDIVLCDGGIHLLTSPHQQCELARTLYRIVSAGGLCIFRLFIPPEKSESTDDVLRDLFEGKIPNLNLLKLRLWMTLQENDTKGVPLKQIWEILQKAAPDLNRLAEQIGWPIEHLRVINTYRNSPARYFFVGLDDIRHLFCEDPGGFTLETIRIPTYESGEQCPTVMFRRKNITDTDDEK